MPGDQCAYRVSTGWQGPRSQPNALAGVPTDLVLAESGVYFLLDRQLPELGCEYGPKAPSTSLTQVESGWRVKGEERTPQREEKQTASSTVFGPVKRHSHPPPGRECSGPTRNKLRLFHCPKHNGPRKSPSPRCACQTITSRVITGPGNWELQPCGLQSASLPPGRYPMPSRLRSRMMTPCGHETFPGRRSPTQFSARLLPHPD